MEVFIHRSSSRGYALIDGTYGVITEGVEGATYEIVYSFTHGCANKDTATATVIEVIEGFTTILLWK